MDARPLVLSLRLDRRDRSRRWKQVIEPTPRCFMHHLELRRAEDVDEEVKHRLAEAWELADQPRTVRKGAAR